MSTRNWIFFLGAVCLILFLGACSPNPQPVGATAVPSLAPGATLTLNPAIQSGIGAGAAASGPGDPAAGAAIFLQHCTPCHGTQGEGAATSEDRKGPALRNNAYIASANLQAVLDTISNGRPGTLMPAWIIGQGGPLNGAQVLSAATYLLSLQNVPSIPAATPVPAEATETPAPAAANETPEPAMPSNPGSPGPAASLAGDAGRGKPLFGAYCATCHGPEGILGYPNPGTDDMFVPPLNPIDETIISSDKAKYIANVDLFIEHGSVPGGDSPLLIMPNFGDGKMLTPQQIADIIAYVISLNAPK